jgi:YVTN family beta-propeller protein
MHRILRRLSLGALVGLGLPLAVAAVGGAPKAPAYHLVKKIAVGGDGGWDYLTMDAASRHLYISRGTHVIVVDVDTEKVVGDIPDTRGVHGIALAPKLGRGFTSNGQDNSVTVFDLKTFKEITRVKVGTRPDAILFDPATNRVFTFNGGSNDATAISAAEDKVAGTVSLGGRPEFAVADGKGEVFVNLEDKSEIVAFDSQSLVVKNHWPLSPGEEPSGLAMDRKNRRLFSVCGNEKMVVMNADTGKVVATPAIGKGPDASAFDPGAGLAFSSNGEDGTLTIVREVKPDQFDVEATVPTQAGARTMALDTKNHAIYLVTAQALPAEPGAPRYRRNYAPGSFVILVVRP